MTSHPRRIRTWKDQLVWVGVGAIGGAGLVAVQGLVPPAWLGWATGLLSGGIGVWSCLKGPRPDELDLAGVKFAWLWGGFAGMSLGFGLAVWAALAGRGLHWPQLVGEQAAFALGIVLVLGAQMLAWGAILLWWRWRKGAL
ncbi:MAG: hypothetical protein WCO82_04880 [Sphingomonadales bacterium]|jgi:hypothetical protein